MVVVVHDWFPHCCIIGDRESLLHKAAVVPTLFISSRAARVTSGSRLVVATSGELIAEAAPAPLPRSFHDSLVAFDPAGKRLATGQRATAVEMNIFAAPTPQ